MLVNYTFYFLASIMIMSASLVVVLRSPIYNLFSLLICFFSLSGMFILLNAELLALFVLLIYSVGLAIVFVFILMTVNLQSINYKKLCRSSIFGFGVIMSEVITILMIKLTHEENIFLSNVQQYTSQEISEHLALSLFGDYASIVVIIGLVLIVGMVGGVVLLHDKHEEDKHPKLKVNNVKPVELKSVKFNQGVDIC